MSRAIIISFFIFAISFGMILTNQVNTLWEAEYGGKLIGYENTPYLNYSDTGVPQTRAGYNTTTENLATFLPPSSSTDTTADMTQNIKYSQIIFDLLFTATFGFPQFLTRFGMPGMLVTPLTIFLVINHMLALIYMVTGRTFVY